jgi:hypothetical protein
VKTALWLALTISTTAASPSLQPLQSPARDVEVVGVDYAFTVPATLPAGLTTFHFRNAGQHAHELNIFLLKRGVTIDEVIRTRKAGGKTNPLTDGAIGVLFADKGKPSSATLSAELLPGRDYGVLCIFTDTAGARPHYELGMYKSIHISPDARPASAAVRADSVIAVDYAFRYPHEMSPGRHSLAFRNDGKQRHELLIQLLKKGVTLDSVLATAKAKGDVDALTDDGIGVLHARGGESSLGQLNVEFLPGREYMIVCTFMDDDKSPPHYALGMYGSIRVPAKTSS